MHKLHTNIEDIIFDTRAEAEKVRAYALEVFDKYGCLTVADICELASAHVITRDWNDEAYGWVSRRQVDDMSVIRVRDGYAIYMSKPYFLGKTNDMPNNDESIEIHFRNPAEVVQFLNNYTKTSKRPLKIFVD